MFSRVAQTQVVVGQIPLMLLHKLVVAHRWGEGGGAVSWRRPKRYFVLISKQGFLVAEKVSPFLLVRMQKM